MSAFRRPRFTAAHLMAIVTGAIVMVGYGAWPGIVVAGVLAVLASLTADKD